MFLRNLIAVLFTVTVCANAASTPARSTTFHFSNTTSAISTSTSSSSTASITGGCCFVVQDTVSEDWWNMTTFSTGQAVINLTSITVFVTPFLNGTVTRNVTNVYLTNGTFSWPFTGGVNPITDYVNGALPPSQVTEVLSGSAVVTGGVTVNSPAAFYVYNSVKIISVAAVTDESGNKACGTTSSWPQPTDANDTFVALTFDGINSNAEAYFGGYGAAGLSLIPTATATGTFIYYDPSSIEPGTTGESIGFSTIFLNTEGSTMGAQPTATETVEISLTTPFIYQPDRGTNGGIRGDSRCSQGPGKDNYGYVPQEVIDYLAGIPAYSSQYPGLASCLPGGPSILQADCFVPDAFVQSATPGDLTSTTVSTVNPGGAARVTPPPQSQVQVQTLAQGSPGDVVQPVSQTQPQNNPPPLSHLPNQPVSVAQAPPAQSNQAPNQPVSVAQVPPPQSNQAPPSPPPNQPVSTAQAPPNPGGQSTPPAQPQSQPSLGAIINSMIGGAPNTPTPQPITIAGPTTIPVVNAPAGIQGNTQTVQGTPVIIVPQATTIQPAQGSPQAQPIVIPGPTTIPVVNAPPGLQGSTVNVQGTPVIIVPQATTIQPAQGSPQAQPIVIPGPTTIPVAGAPSGLAGETTIIGGQPFIIVPSATTLPAAQGPVVIGGPTTIPLAGAPAGLQGSTTIVDGSSFLVIPAATTLPAGPALGFIIPGPTTVPVAGAPAGLQGSTTIIGGTPFIIVPGATTLPVVPQGFVIPEPTTIPVAGAPAGVQGSTTIIGGTPFIIVPAATTLPIAPGDIPGVSTTLISGTPFVLLPGPTTIPLSEAPTGLSGSTTTINGTPFLIVPSATTLPLSQATGVSTTEFGGISFLIYPSPTTIPLSGAPAGLSGSTTTINGTPFLIIPSPTTIPISPSTSSSSITTPTFTFPGRITVISGSEFEIFSGPTTVPVDPSVSLKGKTTVISGTTEVVLTAATTALVRGTGSANGGASKSSAVSGRDISWVALVGIAFGLVFW